MNKKDLQIMEILAKNCRIPNTTIAKTLKVSKDTVAYKIKQLEKSKMINQYVLFIDARRFGYTRYHILINFDSDIENKQEIYDKLCKHKDVMWINTFIGRYDKQIIVDAKDGFHLNQIREELFKLCEHQIKDYIILTHLSDLEFTQLNPILDLNTKFTKKLDYSFSSILTTKRFPVGPNFNKYKPTRIEIEILKILADNPKESLINMSKILKVDRQTIKKRIINLIEQKIILNFGGIPNLAKLGFITYYMLVRVEQETPLEVLKKPFEELNNIFYAGHMIGDYDMILYLNARNPDELNSSIELFKKQLGKRILHYDLLVQDKVHFWRQFHNGLYEGLKEDLF
ncbi:Lrp/AsnC family transcriptional regulator [Candidatus Woesearchaeota archaeon]|nr:Lrp/AsnC family transcriptional regulator [Candidatus Woesearchaeota archaeon]